MYFNSSPYNENDSQLNLSTFKPEHLPKLPVETLFYMFYVMNKDIMQSLAAQELYRRNWKFHSELKIWLKPRNPQENNNGSLQLMFFDISTWEAKPFTANVRGNIATGFASEEDIRIKSSNEAFQSNPLFSGIQSVNPSQLSPNVLSIISANLPNSS